MCREADSSSKTNKIKVIAHRNMAPPKNGFRVGRMRGESHVARREERAGAGEGRKRRKRERGPRNQ